MTFDTCFRNSIEKVQVSLKSDKNKRNFYEDRCAVIILSRSLPFRMGKFSDRSYRESQNTHFVFNNFFLGNRDVYVIM